jgi:hypothetical protein
VAVSALQRAADLSDGPHRAMRLLDAAELGFEIGQHDLVLGLLAQAGQLGLPSREQPRLMWIRESFTDGVPGDAAQARALAAAAEQASANGDTDLALKLLYGAGLRCWWVDPGQAARDQIVAAAERLEVDETDPRLLVVLASAAPEGVGFEPMRTRQRPDGFRPDQYDPASYRLAPLRLVNAGETFFSRPAGPAATLALEAGVDVKIVRANPTLKKRRGGTPLRGNLDLCRPQAT